MGDIPSPVWVIVGLLIAGFSFFVGFLRKMDNSAFFKLMLFVGLGMIVFGVFKFIMKRKKNMQEFEQRKHHIMQKRERSAEIDIDDYRNNPHLRQQAMQQQDSYTKATQPSHQHQQAQHTPHTSQQHDHHQTHQQGGHTGHHTTQHQKVNTHNKKEKKARFCPHCGTPLLPKHKFCPICNAQV